MQPSGPMPSGPSPDGRGELQTSATPLPPIERDLRAHRGRGVGGAPEVQSLAEHGEQLHGPMEYAAQFASRRPSPEALAWAFDGFEAHLNAQGDVSPARCLRMPTTPSKLRRMQRDMLIAEAAAFMEAGGLWGRCTALSTAMNDFLTRGSWLLWRHGNAPPPGTSRFRAVLFFIAKTPPPGKGLSAISVDRSIKNFDFLRRYFRGVDMRGFADLGRSRATPKLRGLLTIRFVRSSRKRKPTLPGAGPRR